MQRYSIKTEMQNFRCDKCCASGILLFYQRNCQVRQPSRMAMNFTITNYRIREFFFNVNYREWPWIILSRIIELENFPLTWIIANGHEFWLYGFIGFHGFLLCRTDNLVQSDKSVEKSNSKIRKFVINQNHPWDSWNPCSKN